MNDPKEQPEATPESSKFVPGPEARTIRDIPGMTLRKEPEPPEPPLTYATAAPEIIVPGSKDMAFLFIILAAVMVLFPLWMRNKPDHCPNDASRWNTVFFLVEYGTMEWTSDWKPLEWHGGRGKATLEEYDEKVRNNAIKVGDKYFTVYDQRFWNIPPFMSIDMIKVGEKYYSSKPPFLSIVVAGVVWGIKSIGDLDFYKLADTQVMMRTAVTLLQVIPFLFCVWLLAKEFRRMSNSLFVRNFCIASAALATYLTPYLIPLSNHVIGASCVTIAIYAGIRIWYDKSKSPVWYFLAGTFGALAVCMELPAAAFLAAILCLMLIRSPSRTIMAGLLPVVVLLGAYFYTSYLVTGELRPIPSMINDEGGVYDYPGSYWHPNKYNPEGPHGMDGLDEPKGIYLFHMLLGHHGFFLLTPIFIISYLGIFANMFRKDERARPMLALGTLVISIAVTAFYTYKTHNYGGGAQGFRWLFWIIPLWLLMLPAGVEILARVKLGRGICYLLFVISMFSVYWALPQVDDKGEAPFSNSWAHEMFRKEFCRDWIGWMPDRLEIDY